MKNLLFLIALTIISFSCKSTINPDNLPKPLPERPKDNPDNGSLTAEESQEMETLKAEILAISKSEKCTNGSDWKSVGLGVKACGDLFLILLIQLKLMKPNFWKKSICIIRNQQSIIKNTT
jgi:hypothetical protein